MTRFEKSIFLGVCAAMGVVALVAIAGFVVPTFDFFNIAFPIIVGCLFAIIVLTAVKIWQE